LEGGISSTLALKFISYIIIVIMNDLKFTMQRLVRSLNGTTMLLKMDKLVEKIGRLEKSLNWTAMLHKLDRLVKKIDRLVKRLNEIVLLQKVMLDFNECKLYMGISASQLYKLTSKRAIPFYKPFGSKLYFKREEIDAYLQQNRNDSERELSDAANECLMNKKFNR